MPALPGGQEPCTGHRDLHLPSQPSLCGQSGAWPPALECSWESVVGLSQLESRSLPVQVPRLVLVNKSKRSPEGRIWGGAPAQGQGLAAGISQKSPTASGSGPPGSSAPGHAYSPVGANDIHDLG